MSTPLCPVCGQALAQSVCPHCGYDESRDYIRYPSLAALPRSASPMPGKRRPRQGMRKAKIPQLRALYDKLLSAKIALSAVELSDLPEEAEPLRKSLELVVGELESMLHSENAASDFRYTVTANCAKITGYKGDGGDVVIPAEIDGKPVTGIGDSAFSCCALTSIRIPDSVTSIEEDAFYGCHTLTAITVPNSVTSIGDRVFFGCNSLRSVTLSDSIKSIGDSAFATCISLTLVTIPRNVTSIGNFAFSACVALTSITIPGSVTSIGRAAFSGCNSLANVYYVGSEKQWKAMEIKNQNFAITRAKIHYNAK